MEETIGFPMSASQEESIKNNKYVIFPIWAPLAASSQVISGE
jgi:hypothetical protein